MKVLLKILDKKEIRIYDADIIYFEAKLMPFLLILVNNRKSIAEHMK